MTLYQYVTGGYRTQQGTFYYQEASPADVLRWQEWETCPTCGGHGVLGGYGITDPCPDCAHGVIPPDWMIEAAAKGLIAETFKDTPQKVKWERQPSSWHDVVRRQARVALVAAARKGADG